LNPRPPAPRLIGFQVSSRSSTGVTLRRSVPCFLGFRRWASARADASARAETRDHSPDACISHTSGLRKGVLASIAQREHPACPGLVRHADARLPDRHTGGPGASDRTDGGLRPFAAPFEQTNGGRGFRSSGSASSYVSRELAWSRWPEVGLSPSRDMRRPRVVRQQAAEAVRASPDEAATAARRDPG
jgi:hypothetical protein